MSDIPAEPLDIIAGDVVREFRKLQKSGMIEDQIYFESAMDRLDRKVQHIRAQQVKALTSTYTGHTP